MAVSGESRSRHLRSDRSNLDNGRFTTVAYSDIRDSTMRFALHSFPVFLLTAGAILHAAEISTQRIDIHVDGERPLAGERSRFVIAQNGEVFFTYTLAAGELAGKPLGIISPNGEIRLTGIDSESTWNVEGWGTYGFPFDLCMDDDGDLHVATRHRGVPYGVDYWQRVEGVWKLESFGAGVTFGGNNVSLGLLPDGRPVVVCLDRNQTQLAVWERSAVAGWSVTRPRELTSVAPGQFDLETGNDGALHVVFCPLRGAPICATRDKEGVWSKQPIGTAAISRMIATASDSDGRLHVSYASRATAGEVRELTYATMRDDGSWASRTVAQSSDERHVGRTDISAANGRVAIAWEHGPGPAFVPKDYGGAVGAVMLTVIDEKRQTTHEVVARQGGRPGLSLSADGRTAWVGVYTGNEGGDDFYLLNCRLDGTRPLPACVVDGTPQSMYRDGCLKDIDSGNASAERRGLQRIDTSQLSAEQRQSLIGRFLNHDDPLVRLSMVRELARSPDALNRFSQQLPGLLDDAHRLVPKTLLQELAAADADPLLVRPVLVQALTGSDAMTRLAAAEVLRTHHDWVEQHELTQALETFARDLGHEDRTLAGSASMAFERLIDCAGTADRLRLLGRSGSPLQRARAELVLFRCGHEIDPAGLADIPTKGSEQAQLVVCGLVGQWRSEAGVPLLRQLLDSRFPAVRTAAVYALRSVAHVAELKPVARHPKGFDLLALRAIEPDSEEIRSRQQAAIAGLIAALAHADPNVCQKACDALGRVRAKQALPAIELLTDAPDGGVRTAARTAAAILADRPSQELLVDHTRWKKNAGERKQHRLGNVHRPPTEIVDDVVQAGGDKQLLIDDFVIESSSGLRRRLHPFVKHPRNPVFQAQVPWEEGWADPFMSTVVYDAIDRDFKMWYRCGPRHSLKGFAVSADGIHWQRPDVAQSKWQEFEHHNLVGFDGRIATWKKPGNNVLFFPDARGTDRYLSLFYRPNESDYAVSRSADGVNWGQPESVRHAYGDVVSLIRHPGRERYLFFPKYRRENDGFARRSFAATALKELGDPFVARFPFLAGHRDDGRVAEDASRAYGSLLKDTIHPKDFHAEIYSVTAIPYEGVVVALYDLWPVVGSAEGPLDMPVKVSRDMQNWHDVDYPSRALSIGRLGEWDSGMVYGGNTLLVVDDEIRLYYLGANMGHCTRVLPATRPYHSVGVGLATLRLDGFASMQPADKRGQFTTRPLAFNGDRLQINGLCKRSGSIRVELLDADGEPLPGFSLSDCKPFEGDSLRHTVTWRTEGTIPASIPRTIRLRFELTSADLFAFQFVSDD